MRPDDARVRTPRAANLGLHAGPALHDHPIWWKHADLIRACQLGADLLHPDDAARARRRTRRAQSESLAARALLRALVCDTWGTWWARARLAHAVGGAPFLPDRPDCSISLSHSGDQVAVALSTTADVGIDIQWMDPHLKLEPVIRRCFHPREIEAMEHLAKQERQALFYAWWVAKEAVVKCLRKGLALSTASFVVPHPLGCGPVLGLDTQMWVTALPAPTGYRAALAWRDRRPSRGHTDTECSFKSVTSSNQEAL
jgi:4'-phosphopantetheinyl transferase